ncbi:MAG: hypothetical protein Fur0014_03650 [Rubrivivax sp.]
MPAQPGQLAAYAVQRLRQRSASPVLQTAAGTAPSAAAMASQADRSVPLAQEDGVAEADLLQADASTVLSLAGTELHRHRLEVDGTLVHLQSLTLPFPEGSVHARLSGLHLAEAASRAVVLGHAFALGQWTCSGEVCIQLAMPTMVPVQSSVIVQPVTTGATLEPGTPLVIDGRLVGSRRIGNRLVLVTHHVPALAVDGTTGAQREAALAALTAADLLPRVRIGAAEPVPLVAETDCLLQPGNASPAVEITTVTVLDLASPGLTQRSRCFVGGTEAMTMTPESLVLATTRHAYQDQGTLTVYPAAIRTDLHRFAFDADGTPVYRASGTVDGHLGWDPERKPYRLSESAGHLRVLSYTGSTGWGTTPSDQTPASPATLTVLREQDGMLAEVARLPNARRPEAIGKPGEQVYGVRFVGDRGYVVTFRRVDPLYVLDLADPADPRIAGALEITGFSGDLVPMGAGWLLGVGRAADAGGLITGLKVSLFDVRDAAAPRLAAAATLGGPGSHTALDSSRQGLNLRWVGDVARVALPVMLAGTDPQHGLQRFEVDTATGTLAGKPLLTRAAASPWVDLSGDRSLQIGDRLVWLSAGTLSTAAW